MNIESAIETPALAESGCFWSPARSKADDHPIRAAKLKQAIEHLEQRLIIEALKQASGNQSKAARELGITDRIMGLRVRKYRIDPRDFRSNASQSTRWL